MLTEITQIGLAFAEGFALIISPCILPILPIILSGSLEGGKKRPVGIIVGFVAAFALLTLFSRKLVQISGIDIGIIRNISFVLLILFGIIMLSPYLYEQFGKLTNRFANIGSKLSSTSQGGFFSGLLFGALVGLIWTPCAGPILAAVIVQTVIQKTTWLSLLTVLAFGIGAAVPMLIIALFGRRFLKQFSFFREHAVLIRQILGAIIIASVIAMYFSSSFSSSFVKPNATTTTVTQNALIGGLAQPYAAPPIEGISGWLNSPPLQLSQLKGKVVLIDFWAYSCINCVRTLPYLKNWYQQYHDKGFEIIGVHSPEFDFERNYDNVKDAAKKYQLNYPIALDNDFKTWQNFNNHYWPAHYLIDKNGNVVYEHFGEGEYNVTENNIRFLLGLNAKVSQPAAEISLQPETPETYLGYERADAFASPQYANRDAAFEYTYPTMLNQDHWALRGKWIIAGQKIISAQANAAIKIHFQAKKVYAVMGNSSGFPIQVKLTLNGEPHSNTTVSRHTLYTLIELKQSSSGILELTASAPGLEIYTFTFGS